MFKKIAKSILLAVTCFIMISGPVVADYDIEAESGGFVTVHEFFYWPEDTPPTISGPSVIVDVIVYQSNNWNQWYNRTLITEGEDEGDYNDTFWCVQQ